MTDSELLLLHNWLVGSDDFYLLKEMNVDDSLQLLLDLIPMEISNECYVFMNYIAHYPFDRTKIEFMIRNMREIELNTSTNHS